jgi:hypothetical protein
VQICADVHFFVLIRTGVSHRQNLRGARSVHADVGKKVRRMSTWDIWEEGAGCCTLGLGGTAKIKFRLGRTDVEIAGSRMDGIRDGIQLFFLLYHSGQSVAVVVRIAG